MTEELLNLRHGDFERLVPNIIRNLGKHAAFTDVTLVSSEGNTLQAHKVILASCSLSNKTVDRLTLFCTFLVFHDITLKI